MNLSKSSRKDIGNLGERVAAEYLRRLGFSIIGRNIAFKTGELDVMALNENTLHIVEVKTVVCVEFPNLESQDSGYDPAWNLHPYKIRKVRRTAEWYVADKNWEGEWQIDGALVWLRQSDGMARVRYYPQIV
ncbi:MAG: YraN family protein [Candidatus Paceibacterota bacterium]